MEDAVSSGILVGRPFGGVSIAWSPHLNHLISPLSNFRHKRVVGVELSAGDKSFLLLNVYMPFFNSSRRAECMTETVDAITMLESMIEAHPHHEIIIGGDLNCELKGNSPFDPLWANLKSKFGLESCDNFLPASSFTYCHNSLDQRKLNDHFMVSKSLIENNILKNHRILEDGDNPSDHLPIVTTLSLNASLPTHEPSQKTLKDAIKWEKISVDAKTRFTYRVHDFVNSRPSSDLLSHCRKACRCDDSACQQAIQEEYDFLTQCVKDADSFLPRHKPGVEKDWWTADLTDLRRQSMEAQTLWVNQGRPRQGPAHEERLRVRALYKRAIRAAQRAPKQKAWDRLHSDLSQKDTNSFWKSWKTIYNKNKSHLAPVVNGCSSKQAIANSFQDSFQKNFTPNNQAQVDNLNDRFSQAYQDYREKHATACDCNSFRITLSDTIDALGAMKGGKCADESGISAEHLHFAPLNLLIRLTLLFNSMLKHAFVPRQFQLGFIVPIIKNQQGNHSDTSNYRGITISPIISKLLEHILKTVFFAYLSTSNMQFGFKRSSSTSHALHCMKQTVNYYVNNGSRVFCCFLDASKAFDRVVHSGLFLKLIERNVPLIFIDLIISWYGSMYCRVRWGECFSNWFIVTAGVRQGGILSPDLYSIYVDDLLKKLRSLQKGCYYLKLFAAAYFYADDMAIMAPSIKALKSLLKECSDFCVEWDICLNANKTKILYF